MKAKRNKPHLRIVAKSPPGESMLSNLCILTVRRYIARRHPADAIKAMWMMQNMSLSELEYVGRVCMQNLSNPAKGAAWFGWQLITCQYRKSLTDELQAVISLLMVEPSAQMKAA